MAKVCQMVLTSTLVVGVTLIFPTTNALAQNITLDGTLGKQGTLTGPNYVIPQSVGQAVGNNLFHSFGKFNLDTNEAAIFKSTDNIENILSRVTGGSPSSIDGLIRTLDNDVNLFLINPSGIVFGENARLDVSGSFVASTADSFVFGNGLEFSAINPQAAPLLKVNLTPGLQYGKNHPSRTIKTSGNLTAGEDLKLFAGNLDLQGQLQAGRDLSLEADTIKVRDSATNPFIAAAGNKLSILGRESVDIFALNHPHSGFFSGGNMVLSSANPVVGDIHFWSGGNFQIEKLDKSKGDLFSFYDPIIRSQGDVSFFAYQGASLHILAGGKVDINTAIITSPDTTGESINPVTTPNLANVTLSDGTSLVIDGSERPTVDIRAGVDPAVIGSPLGTLGDGGTFFNSSIFPVAPPNNNPVATSADITIGYISINSSNGLVFLTNQYEPNLSLQGGDVTVNGDGLFGSGINTTSFDGDGGDVFIDARNGIILNSRIYTFAFSDSGLFLGNGDGGDVTLLAKDNININPESPILSLGLLGGSLTIKSDGDVVINSVIDSASFSPLSGQTGGNINLIARSLSMSNGGGLGTFTLGNANAGDINIQTSKSISIDGSVLNSLVLGEAIGNGGNLSIETGQLTLSNGAQISARTSAGGNAGNIEIKAKSVEVIGTDRTGQLPSGFFARAQNGATGNGGNLTIKTENFFISDRAQLSISTLGNGNAGNFTIDTKVLKVTDGGQILASTSGSKNAGNLQITADSIELIGTDTTGNFASGFRSTTEKNSIGNGGDLTINTGKLFIADGAQISVSTFDKGNAGNLFINAKSVEVIGESIDTQFLRLSGLFTQVNQEATGNGGNLNIQTESLKIANGAQVSASTFGDGFAGDLTIKADSSVEVIGRSSDGEFPSALFARVDRIGKGLGGNLTIVTNSLRIIDGGLVSASTLGEGNAGNLNVKANSIEIVGTFPNGNFSLLNNGVASSSAIGNGGDLIIETNSLKIAEGGIELSTFGEGNAGNLQLKTDYLLVTDGGFIAAGTSGKGNAGKMTINASEIELFGADKDGFSSKFSVQVEPQAIGNAGNLKITTKKLSLLDGAKISAETFGNGNAGRIDLNADKVNITGLGSQISAITFSKGVGGIIFLSAKELSVTNGGQILTTTSSINNAGNITLNVKDNITLSGSETGIFANTTEGSTGKGGSIIIDPRTVIIQDGATIAVDSQGEGIGGDIDLTAGFLTLDNGTISAETRSNTGGNITLNLEDLLLLRNGSKISTTAGNQQFGGDGGNITINTPPFIVAVPKENSDITANAFTGKGGNINIQAKGIFGIIPRELPTEKSDITASSELGVSGQVTINTPEVDPSRGLVQLPSNLVDASQQIAQGCTPRGGQNRSSFISTGRGGLPLNPNEPLRGRAVITNWVTLPDNGNQQTREIKSERTTKPTPETIVEANGLVINSRGEVELVAQAPAGNFNTSSGQSNSNCNVSSILP